MEKCDCCGKLFNSEDISNYNGQQLCKSCADKKRKNGEI